MPDSLRADLVDEILAGQAEDLRERDDASGLHNYAREDYPTYVGRAAVRRPLAPVPAAGAAAADPVPGTSRPLQSIGQVLHRDG